jgi:hypothetical protein
MPRAIIIDHLDNLINLRCQIIKMERELAELESLFDKLLVQKKDLFEEKLSERALQQVHDESRAMERREWDVRSGSFVAVGPTKSPLREGYDDGPGV